MAFKLSKVDQKRRDDCVAQLNELASELQAAIGTYNDALEELKNPVEAALAAYNDALAEAQGFVEDIASTAQGEFGDKSEKWQEGEKAEEANEWIGAWNEIDLEAIDLVYAEEIETPDLDHASELEALPVAAGEN